MNQNELNFTDCSGCGSGCSCGKDTPKESGKYDNVEPLPESSRPRRDGPGGEDAK